MENENNIKSMIQNPTIKNHINSIIYISDEFEIKLDRRLEFEDAYPL